MIQLNPDEKIIFEVRKHWFYMVLKGAGLFIISAILTVGFYFLLFYSKKFAVIQANGNPAILVTIVGLMVLLISWIVFFSFWTKYYLDYWVVTDERIIDVDLIGFFHQETAVVRLDQIQDITIRIEGFFPSMFGFGTIQVQTAGESREFIMPSIANTEEIKERIFALQRAATEKTRNVRIVE